MMIKLSKRMDEITTNIDKYLSDAISKSKTRDYLGGSVIGKECDRQLWYEFHSPIKNENPRVERIFHLGHLIESYMISLLKHSGYEVFHEEESSAQFGFKDGKLAGSIDGVIMVNGEPYLLEVKSASDKRFKEMVKVGVQQSDPVYFTQMQVYMKYMDLKKSLFVAMNKNDCDIHIEEVVFDNIHADYMINRGKEIVEMTNEPERKYKTSAFYKCKICNYREKCWNGSDN